MPNRVIREGFLDSEKINKLSDKEQLFFIRLILIVDDYGRFDARLELLKSKCYPVTEIGLTDVSNMLSKLKNDKLIILYSVKGKRYLEILIYNQRLRQKKEKFPGPDLADDSNVLTDASKVRLEKKRKEVESESETEKNPEIVFDEFRKLYPGTKRGNDTEYNNFKKHHPDWKEVLPLLKPSVESQISTRDSMTQNKVKFIPSWKNLQTWINNRCWEEETPDIEDHKEAKTVDPMELHQHAIENQLRKD